MRGRCICIHGLVGGRAKQVAPGHGESKGNLIQPARQPEQLVTKIRLYNDISDVPLVSLVDFVSNLFAKFYYILYCS